MLLTLSRKSDKADFSRPLKIVTVFHSEMAAGRASYAHSRHSVSQITGETHGYEALHPETRPSNEGGLSGRGNRRKLCDDIAERFTADTAERTGRSVPSPLRSLGVAEGRPGGKTNGAVRLHA